MASSTDSKPNNTSGSAGGLGNKIRGTFETVHGLGESLRAQGMTTLDNFLGTTSKNEHHARIAEKGKQEVESGMARLRGRPAGTTGPTGYGAGQGSGPGLAYYGSSTTGTGADNVGTDARSAAVDNGGYQGHAADNTAVGGAGNGYGGGYGGVNPRSGVRSASGNASYGGDGIGSGGGLGHDANNIRQGGERSGYQGAGSKTGGVTGPKWHTGYGGRSGYQGAGDETGGVTGPEWHTGYGAGAEQRHAGLQGDMKDRENLHPSGSQYPRQPQATGAGSSSPRLSNPTELESSGIDNSKAPRGSIQSIQAPPELPPRNQNMDNAGSQQMYG